MQGGSQTPRRVMLVADPTRESAGALQYALSHAVVDKDTLILFHVDNPTARKNRFGSIFKKSNNNDAAPPAFPAAEAAGDVDFLDTMKQACTASLPMLNIQVEKMEMAEGQDKASIILAQSWVHSVDLIIVGQKKKLPDALVLGSLLFSFLSSSFLKTKTTAWVVITS